MTAEEAETRPKLVAGEATRVPGSTGESDGAAPQMTETGRIAPSGVRYIKLGKGGGWERECLADGIARFGYGTERPSRFAAAREGRWADLTKLFLGEGKSKGTATQFGERHPPLLP